MSDEQTPPPTALRLKPRLRPAEPSATTAAAVSTVEPAQGGMPPVTTVSGEVVGEVPAAPKIRLAPRLSATPAIIADPTPPTPPVVIEAAIPNVVIAPEKSAESQPEAAPESARFKLKARPPASEPPPVLFQSVEPPTMAPMAPPPPVIVPANVASPAPSSAPAPAPPRPKSVPPFPVVAAPGAGAPGVPGVPPSPKRPVPVIRKAAPRSGTNRLLIGVALVVSLTAVGFFGWQRVAAAKPKAEAAKTPHAGTPNPAPASPPKSATATPAGAVAHAGLTPSETLNKIAAAPVNAINKAQDAIDKRRASGQTRVDAAALGEDAPEKPAVAAVPTTPKKPSTTPPPSAMTSVAPGVAASVHVEAAADASTAFRSFVANTRVNGVFQGTPPRAMINGRLVRVGETVENGLGITLDNIDVQRKQLVFKDYLGAIVSRNY
jgi:hypothetical protein